MAYEYTWYGDSELDTPGLTAFIAATTGGEERPDGTIFLAGMYVTARSVTGEDVNPAVSLFGFEHRFTATFRISSRVDDVTEEHATALMVHTVIAFASRFGGHGVLLFNGETAVLLHAGDHVVLDAEWEDWTENSEIAPLLDQFDSEVLPQPLL
ncbi:SitI3 family protein [Paractinoplanes toevensis]|uniref:Uncharacterized protein n=1 Tax=Paractinoplanes toevensis TaxID=571911 RepID=A0A919T6F4_9ACTN|nr:SitI3 family protein [Actinoplanes toevensis]GIM89743.1 hypothetical protein Ato02nite_015360 [Actinoplanes toevensis]